MKDPQSLFYYAELLKRKKKLAEATDYYEILSEWIQQKKTKVLSEQMMLANIYKSLKKNSHAINLYKRLWGNYPKNRNLKIEYANFLIELGKIKDAEILLLK